MNQKQKERMCDRLRIKIPIANNADVILCKWIVCNSEEFNSSVLQYTKVGLSVIELFVRSVFHFAFQRKAQ